MSGSAPLAFNLNSPSLALVYKNHRILKALFILAAFSFLTTLDLQYLGEEGVYTISSLEMWFNREWLNPTQYGTHYNRPPFFNWLIIPLASFLGWDHLLLASRLVSASATLITAGVLLWMMQQLFHSKPLAWLTGAIFLSGDLLLRRGWLAYADPVFALFVFTAIACAMVAVAKRKPELLLLASLSICAAFLTKAITAYLFYAIALFVLVWKHKNREVLLSPVSIICQILAFSFPLLWDNFISHGSHTHSMINDVLAKLSLNQLMAYFTKLVIFPIDFLFRLLPASGIALYFLWEARRKKIDLTNVFDAAAESNDSTAESNAFKILVWVSVLNFLPYWVAPHAHIRYLLPLYPLCAAIFAYLIFTLGERPIKITVFFLTLGLVLKYILGFWGYGIIEQKVRGNYVSTAEDILKRTQGFSLCAADDTATGLSVVANIDVLRLPEAPLKVCQKENRDLFLLAEKPEQHKNTEIVYTYTLGRNKLYVLCRGAACQKDPST